MRRNLKTGGLTRLIRDRTSLKSQSTEVLPSRLPKRSRNQKASKRMKQRKSMTSKCKSTTKSKNRLMSTTRKL